MLKRGFGDAMIIVASSTKHLEENLVELEKRPLTEGVVHALNAPVDGRNKSDIWKVLALSE
jgi:aryl-alcohol dehydrogenase-like predicted oxidoreductase